MSLRRRSRYRKVFLVVALLLVGGFLGGACVWIYQLGQRVVVEKEAEPLEEVITVGHSVEVGQCLTEEDLLVMSVPQQVVPSNSVTNKDELIGKKATIKLEPRVVMTTGSVYQNEITETDNIQEVTLASLPLQLMLDQYVDLRIQFPTGHDYCVAAEKKLLAIDYEQKKILIALAEIERLRLSSALTDAQHYENARLYLTVYPSASQRVATTVRYPVNGSIQQLYQNIYFDEQEDNERQQLDKALAELVNVETSLFLPAEPSDMAQEEQKNHDADDLKNGNEEGKAEEDKRDVKGKKETNVKEEKPVEGEQRQPSAGGEETEKQIDEVEGKEKAKTQGQSIPATVNRVGQETF